jgi:hypothetical protein
VGLVIGMLALSVTVVLRVALASVGRAGVGVGLPFVGVRLQSGGDHVLPQAHRRRTDRLAGGRDSCQHVAPEARDEVVGRRFGGSSELLRPVAALLGWVTVRRFWLPQLGLRLLGLRGFCPGGWGGSLELRVGCGFRLLLLCGAWWHSGCVR